MGRRPLGLWGEIQHQASLLLGGPSAEGSDALVLCFTPEAGEAREAGKPLEATVPTDLTNCMCNLSL